LLSCCFKIVSMQMYILLYYWTNKMMMMIRQLKSPRKQNKTHKIVDFYADVLESPGVSIVNNHLAQVDG